MRKLWMDLNDILGGISQQLMPLATFDYTSDLNDKPPGLIISNNSSPPLPVALSFLQTWNSASIKKKKI